MSWNPLDLPPQPGKTFVVTGGNAGVGYFTVEQLAATGARVIIAGRSPKRMSRAVDSVRHQVPGAQVETIVLDLASLESVRAAAEQINAVGEIDGLVQNAAITSPPKTRETTVDGWELVVGTNHIGHFALTALTAEALSSKARVITVGSLATRMAAADESDLLSEENYRPFRAYAASKHATTVFGFELDRRLRAVGSTVQAIVAHPGAAIGHSPGRPGITDVSAAVRVRELLGGAFSQGRDRGAWPIVRALLDPAAVGGQYYGPAGKTRGGPAITNAVSQDYDTRFAKNLWALSEQWTGIPFVVTRGHL